MTAYIPKLISPDSPDSLEITCSELFELLKNDPQVDLLKDTDDLKIDLKKYLSCSSLPNNYDESELNDKLIFTYKQRKILILRLLKITCDVDLEDIENITDEDIDCMQSEFEGKSEICFEIDLQFNRRGGILHCFSFDQKDFKSSNLNQEELKKKLYEPIIQKLLPELKFIWIDIKYQIRPKDIAGMFKINGLSSINAIEIINPIHYYGGDSGYLIYFELNDHPLVELKAIIYEANRNQIRITLDNGIEVYEYFCKKYFQELDNPSIKNIDDLKKEKLVIIKNHIEVMIKNYMNPIIIETIEKTFESNNSIEYRNYSIYLESFSLLKPYFYSNVNSFRLFILHFHYHLNKLNKTIPSAFTEFEFEPSIIQQSDIQTFFDSNIQWPPNIVSKPEERLLTFIKNKKVDKINEYLKKFREENYVSLIFLTAENTLLWVRIFYYESSSNYFHIIAQSNTLNVDVVFLMQAPFQISSDIEQFIKELNEKVNIFNGLCGNSKFIKKKDKIDIDELKKWIESSFSEQKVETNNLKCHWIRNSDNTSESCYLLKPSKKSSNIEYSESTKNKFFPVIVLDTFKGSQIVGFEKYIRMSVYPFPKEVITPEDPEKLVISSKNAEISSFDFLISYNKNNHQLVNQYKNEITDYIKKIKSWYL